MRHRFVQAGFQNLLGGVKHIELGVPHGGIHQRFLWNQAHQLGIADADAVALCFAAHHLYHASDRGLAEVGQVHRYLGAAFHQQAQPFHVAQPARRVAHRFGDLLRDAHIIRGEVSVEGD